MNKAQKEVQQYFLLSEEETLKELDKVYSDARDRIKEYITKLYEKATAANMQSTIYQVQYQKALLKQIEAILDELNSNQFMTISDYLEKCYEDGYLGALYDIHSQGIPLIMPIDQAAVVRAVRTDSQIKGSLYNHLGENVAELKKNIASEISRGISTGASWMQTANNISSNMLGSYKNPKGSFAYAMRIARTEGHRIQIQSAMDCQAKAKKNGADIVKQWDSALDGNTRPTHRKLDGQIRELNEDFEIDGKKAAAPGMFGRPEEDCNCRCALLQRARWALDDEELDALKERAKFFKIDKTKDFKEFKRKYLQLPKNDEKY